MKWPSLHGIKRTLEYSAKTMLLAPFPLRDDFVMVSGADRSHFKSLYNLLKSARKWEPNMRFIVYDLGFEAVQREEIAIAFPFIELRQFDYSQYPAYFDIRINAGEFAWKPVIFSEVFCEVRGSVCWFDAGNLILEPLMWLRKLVQWTGFYSPISKGTVGMWTHPATLAFLKADASVAGKPNLTGGCVSANHRSLKARNFVAQWKECALIKECIAPSGSNRYNHRQDMSILAILAYQMRLPMYLSKYRLGFDIQQDVD